MVAWKRKGFIYFFLFFFFLPFFLSFPFFPFFFFAMSYSKYEVRFVLSDQRLNLPHEEGGVRDVDCEAVDTYQ